MLQVVLSSYNDLFFDGASNCLNLNLSPAKDAIAHTHSQKAT